MAKKCRCRFTKAVIAHFSQNFCKSFDGSTLHFSLECQPCDSFLFHFSVKYLADKILFRIIFFIIEKSLKLHEYKGTYFPLIPYDALTLKQDLKLPAGFGYYFQ